MKESIQSNPFYLKPGGAREDASPTELGKSEYTQVSGFDDAGTTMRMPGKRLVKQFDASVEQISGFGGGVLIQYGDKLILYPDACAVAPVPEEYHPTQPVTSHWLADTTGIVHGVGATLQLVGPCNQLIHDFGAVDDLQAQIDFTQYLPAAGGLFAWQVSVIIGNQSNAQRYAPTVVIEHAAPTGHLNEGSINGYEFFQTDTNDLDVLLSIHFTLGVIEN